MKRGWTLVEMLVSLSVTAMIVGLAVHAALGEMRFFRGAGEMAAVERQLREATDIVRATVAGVSSAGGDILVAQDSALEARVPLGTAVVCAGSVGRLVIPMPRTAGNALSSFVESPQPDDIAFALLNDSPDDVWLTLHVATAPEYAGGCLSFRDTDGAWSLTIREPVTIPQGSVLRFVRPMRFSLYRASDGRWYLGVRDWNATAQRFNTIQPVAGPLDAASDVAALSGFRFEYLGVDGAPLDPVADLRQIAAIRVVARATSLRPARIAGIATIAGERFADSVSATVALRNAR